MTKQEHIEEMGKVMPEKIKDPLDNSRYIIFGKSLRREIARIYYNAGYRKLPEDSVVISKEEYEDYKKHVDNCIEEYHRGQHEAEVYYKNIQIPRERNETAENILKDFKLWAREYQKKDTVVDENGERLMTNNEKLNYLYTYLCDKYKVKIKE